MAARFPLRTPDHGYKTSKSDRGPRREITVEGSASRERQSISEVAGSILDWHVGDRWSGKALGPMARIIQQRRFRALQLVALAAALLMAPFVLAQSTTKDTKTENPKDAVTTLEIVVTAGPKNAPVDNASVYLRWDEPRLLRHARQIEFDLKTDMEGVAKVKDVPRRKIIIQVVKTGWRPFGQYYELDKPDQKIEIKLLPPAHWY